MADACLREVDSRRTRRLRVLVLNKQLEEFKSASAMAAEYRKLIIEATREGLNSASASYIDGQLACATIAADEETRHKTLETATGHLHDAGVRVTAASTLVDGFLASRLNVVANAGTEYLAACNDNARIQQITEQVCVAQREIHSKVEAMALRSTLDEKKAHADAIYYCQFRKR